MQISKDLLARLVSAIAGFWQVIGYLYNESIEPKCSSLELTLREQRPMHIAAIAHFNTILGSA